MLCDPTSLSSYDENDKSRLLDAPAGGFCRQCRTATGIGEHRLECVHESLPWKSLGIDVEGAPTVKANL